MELLNLSLPCFAEMDDRSLNDSVMYLRLLFAGASTPSLITSLVAIPLNALSLYLIYMSQVKKRRGGGGGKKRTASSAVSEGALHLMLLAVSDLLVSSSTWILYGFFYIGEATEFCHVLSQAHVVNTWLNVVVTANRWMTFFMAAKRCRILFDQHYALTVRCRSNSLLRGKNETV